MFSPQAKLVMSKVKLTNFCGKHDLIIFWSDIQYPFENLKTITKQFIFWRKQFTVFVWKNQDSGHNTTKRVNEISNPHRNLFKKIFVLTIFLNFFLSVCCFGFLRNNFSKLLSSNIIHFIPQTLKSLLVSFSYVLAFVL